MEYFVLLLERDLLHCRMMSSCQVKEDFLSQAETASRVGILESCFHECGSINYKFTLVKCRVSFICFLSLSTSQLKGSICERSRGNPPSKVYKD